MIRDPLALSALIAGVTAVAVWVGHRVPALSKPGDSPLAIVLGIGGKVTRREAEQALRELTDGWTGTASTVQPRPFDRTASAPSAFRAIDEAGFTTWIAIGPDGPPIGVALFTGADRDFRGLLGRTYTNVFLWPPARDLASSLAEQPCILPAPADLQGEAIGWLADGSAGRAGAP